MHIDLTFPGFSVFHANKADGPPAAGPEVPGEAGELPPDQHPHATGQPGDPAGKRTGRFNRPPFSWLGGDAWPDFPR